MKLTYAIGDIHGQRSLFEQMLELIATDAAGEEHRIITLGDYCDRGPDSKGVYDILMARPDIIALRGNHEDLLLKAIRGRFHEVETFIYNGGDTTLASFGVSQAGEIPLSYIRWIRESTRLYFEDERRAFVHAGVGHRQPDLSKQPEDWLLWIRDPFLSHRQPFFKYIVHGHTHSHSNKTDPSKPEVLHNRCNLDTGAFFTGLLTAAVFDDSQDKPIKLLTAGTPRG